MLAKMPDSLSLSVSILSLVLSTVTAWLTIFRGGTVKMTRPTTVFFGPDGPGDGTKVFLRTLLYATGKKGRIVESMYVKVRTGESAQNFNIWVYGERGNLARGSGLYIGAEGIACNHHFMLPKNATFTFSAAEYLIEVYASIVGNHAPLLLHREKLLLTQEHAAKIHELGVGVYFDWGPDSGGYNAHVEIPRTPGLKHISEREMREMIEGQS